MFLKAKVFLLIIADFFAISISAVRPIIELSSYYDKISPWRELARIGINELKETDCDRNCEEGDLPRLCLFTFTLEYYAAMGTACGNCSNGVKADCFLTQCLPADGFERSVMSINRQIPGPGINVCKNDLIVVNVFNKMFGTAVTIHWHGISQKSHPWMDGVPHVTQCPIIGSESFRYTFPAQDSGTFFYHAHTGIQRSNGLYGALTIREPRVSEPWEKGVYDFDLPEHAIVISDWTHLVAESFLPGLPRKKTQPDSFLVNGLGRFNPINGNENSFNLTLPLATFHMEKKGRYRLRVSSATSHTCPILVQIQNHNMTVIATDGNPVQPVVIDALMIHSGERFDVVVETGKGKLNKTAFWIHVRGAGSCQSGLRIDQWAVLSYGTKPKEFDVIPKRRRPSVDKPFPINTVLNNPDTKCGVSQRALCVTDLKLIGKELLEAAKVVLNAEPDVRMFISTGLHFLDLKNLHREGNYEIFNNPYQNLVITTTMNNISFKFPSTPILQTGYQPFQFCNIDNLPSKCRGNKDHENNNVTPYCECPQVVKLRKNDIVEMTIYDLIPFNIGIYHPFHLHGNSFYVIRMGENMIEASLPSSKPSIERLSHFKLSKNEMNPVNNSGRAVATVFKDTVALPSGGFVTVRFKADNTGAWLFHCHLGWHLVYGMAMVFWVEGDIPQPPLGFPKCGNFDPVSNDIQGYDDYAFEDPAGIDIY